MNTINNVLINGGTGFVGYWMVQTRPKDIFVVFQDRENYETSWEMGKWDAIVHLAPISPVRTLRYADIHGIKVLFASSGAVYNCDTMYANNKRKWESYCAGSMSEVCIARLFTFIGPHLKNMYAITHFIENAKNKKPLEVWGDGSSVRSYLYGEDLGRWMWKLLLDGHGIYDVGSSKPYTIYQTAQLVQTTIGNVFDNPIVFVDKDSPNEYYLPDTKRANELGCMETIGIREAIKRTADDKV